MNKDYRFEVYTEYSGFGDKVYVAKYYDFDSVIGVGDTIEEAIKEAEENLEVYLEYCSENQVAIPSPSIHEDVDYSGKVTLRMSKTLHKLVCERAEKEGVSINMFLNEAVNAYVTRMNICDEVISKTIDKIAATAEQEISRAYDYATSKDQYDYNIGGNVFTPLDC